MPDDRTARAKRALELSEKATEGPWRTFPDAAESRTLLPALARDVLELEATLEARDASCVWEDCRAEALYCADHAVTFAQQMASGPPLASLAQRIAELEAECEVLRQQRDYDYREALDGFAGATAEIDWLESVLTAGREMYERALRGEALSDMFFDGAKQIEANLCNTIEQQRTEIERLQQWTEDDQPLPEDDAIRAAFPTNSGNHEAYAEALRMVSAKRSKAALVALVNWLLVDRERACAERDASRAECELWVQRAANRGDLLERVERRLQDLKDRTAKVK